MLTVPRLPQTLRAIVAAIDATEHARIGYVASDGTVDHENLYAEKVTNVIHTLRELDAIVAGVEEVARVGSASEVALYADVAFIAGVLARAIREALPQSRAAVVRIVGDLDGFTVTGSAHGKDCIECAEDAASAAILARATGALVMTHKRESLDEYGLRHYATVTRSTSAHAAGAL